MGNNTIMEKIKSIMAIVFEISIEELNDKSSINNIKSWDSLKHINFIVFLEKEFGIEFTFDDIMTMISLKRIVEIITLRKS